MAFSITVGHAQKDGRKFVLEVHTDAQGEFARAEYLAEDGADHNAIATARTAVLLASLAEQEFERMLEADVDPDLDPLPPLRFQTMAELVARIREAFRSRNREQLCRIARWILNRIADGRLTDVQIRNAFGLTAPQYNALKTRMAALRDALNSVENAVGE